MQYIVDVSKFLSASLVALSSMLSLGLPHINVLSKVDVLKRSVPRIVDARYGGVTYNYYSCAARIMQ